MAKTFLNTWPAILALLLVAAQCRAADTTGPPAAIPSPAPSPTPRLIPALQPGDGSDLADRLLETGVIRVGIRVWPEAGFAPPAFRGFSNARTGGALNGFEVDVAWLIAQNLGLELEMVEAYPPAIAAGNWRGEWDIAIASLVPFDPPAAQPLQFSTPYAWMPMGLLLPNSANNIQSLTDLAGKQVGVLEHSAYQQLLTPAAQPLTVQGQPLLPPLPSGIRPVAVSNLPKAIRQLGQPENGSSPRLDAIFGPTPVLQEAVKEGEWPVKLAPQAEVVGYQPLAIAVMPQDGLKADRLLAEINKILERLRRQGTLAEVYVRWYGQDFSLPPAPSSE